MGLPIYQIESYQKAPPKVKTYRHHSKIPKLVLATGKHEMSAKKINKNLQTLLEY